MVYFWGVFSFSLAGKYFYTARSGQGKNKERKKETDPIEASQSVPLVARAARAAGAVIMGWNWAAARERRQPRRARRVVGVDLYIFFFGGPVL